MNNYCNNPQKKKSNTKNPRGHINTFLHTCTDEVRTLCLAASHDQKLQISSLCHTSSMSSHPTLRGRHRGGRAVLRGRQSYQPTPSFRTQPVQHKYTSKCGVAARTQKPGQGNLKRLHEWRAGHRLPQPHQSPHHITNHHTPSHPQASHITLESVYLLTIFPPDREK